MKKSILIVFVVAVTLVAMFSVAYSANNGKATLQWDQPTQFTDGTAVQPGDIGHNTVYWGTASGTYSNKVVSSPTDSVTVTGLPQGQTIFMVVTASTSTALGGLESAYSSEVAAAIPAVKTKACGGLRLISVE